MKKSCSKHLQTNFILGQDPDFDGIAMESGIRISINVSPIHNEIKWEILQSMFRCFKYFVSNRFRI